FRQHSRFASCIDGSSSEVVRKSGPSQSGSKYSICGASRISRSRVSPMRASSTATTKSFARCTLRTPGVRDNHTASSRRLSPWAGKKIKRGGGAVPVAGRRANAWFLREKPPAHCAQAARRSNSLPAEVSRYSSSASGARGPRQAFPFVQMPGAPARAPDAPSAAAARNGSSARLLHVVRNQASAAALAASGIATADGSPAGRHARRRIHHHRELVTIRLVSLHQEDDQVVALHTLVGGWGQGHVTGSQSMARRQGLCVAGLDVSLGAVMRAARKRQSHAARCRQVARPGLLLGWVLLGAHVYQAS